MKLLNPVFPNSLKSSDDLPLEIEIALDNEDDLNDFSFNHINCSDLDLKKIEMHHCRFTASSLPNNSITSSFFADVIFENCDLTRSDLSDSTFHRVVFNNCRLTGVDFNDSIFEDCLFYQCQGELSNFSACKTKKLLFEFSQLSNSSFESCKFKETQFKNCKLNQCEFLHTRLKGIDFTSDSITGIRLSGRQELNGAVVSAEQAVELASLLGLIVE